MGGFQYKEVVMMTKQCSIIEARHSLGRMIKTLQPGERITLTRRGEAVAIVLTPDEYARLTGEQRRPWWAVVEQFRQQNDFVELNDQEIDSWRDRSPPRESVW
ncbi:MAG: type II toxin-antitoxin system Phd/YefM family antitoxin [Candidatus Competibacteraceae bacterium]|nr:MAG: type II toxin-antitoxin system Phd/YefM family antitoxin [Candidatus Competibacteraceae bacterium]